MFSSAIKTAWAEYTWVERKKKERWTLVVGGGTRGSNRGDDKWQFVQ